VVCKDRWIEGAEGGGFLFLLSNCFVFFICFFVNEVYTLFFFFFFGWVM
jgi:hypothetical protein